MVKPINLDGVREAKAKASKAKASTGPPDRQTPARPGNDLPDNCPVTPLGTDGETRYYLDADRQLRALPVDKHTRLGVAGLFGEDARAYLESTWPRHDKSGAITGWAPDHAALNLMAACSRAGLWDNRERQRGRGAWLGEAGELVLHTGRTVMSFPTTRKPYHDHTSQRAGLVGRYVYSAGDQVGVPAAIVDNSDHPAADLLELLDTWQWRGTLGAELMLGWIGAAMIGGALKWRPCTWLTGGKGTGKSTLHEVLKGVFGGAIVQTADTTSAGLYQALKHQTLPVSVDELEAETDNRKNSAIIKLARVASSGAHILRGGSDHNNVEFVVRSAFLFSSILIPPLTPQDRSRITVLELGELAKGAEVPDTDAKRLGELGGQLRRRLVDGWARFDGVLDAYRLALQEHGHDARLADQVGTLLACADIMLRDHHEPGSADGWVKALTASQRDESDDNARDEERCLAHLMSSPVDVFRTGRRKSIGEWVRLAGEVDQADDNAGDARRALETFGLKILDPQPAVDQWPATSRSLAVANQHRGLATLFEGSHWQGNSGTMGVWVQAMARLQGAARSRTTLYFAGAYCRATTIPLAVLVDLSQVSATRHDWILKTG